MTSDGNDPTKARPLNGIWAILLHALTARWRPHDLLLCHGTAIRTAYAGSVGFRTQVSIGYITDRRTTVSSSTATSRTWRATYDGAVHDGGGAQRLVGT